jgi:hypothetical protein
VPLAGKIEHFKLFEVKPALRGERKRGSQVVGSSEGRVQAGKDYQRLLPGQGKWEDHPASGANGT